MFAAPSMIALAVIGAQRVAVLPIVVGGDGREVSVSSVYTDVADAIAERPELRAISSEEMFVADAALLGRVQDCGTEARCLAGELRALDARLGLVVVVNLAVSPALVALRLIDVSSAREVAQYVRPLAASEGSVSAAIRARARGLFDEAGYAASARIVVVADPRDAIVLVEQLAAGGAQSIEPQPGAGSVFFVREGAYRVRASKAGHSDEVRELSLAAGEKVVVELALEEQTSFVGSTWFWVGIGAAAIAGAAAVFFIARGNDCVCIGGPGVECPPC